MFGCGEMVQYNTQFVLSVCRMLPWSRPVQQNTLTRYVLKQELFRGNLGIHYEICSLEKSLWNYLQLVVKLRMRKHIQCHYFVQSLPESLVSSYHGNLCLQVFVQGSVTYAIHKHAHMFRRSKTAYMRQELKSCERNRRRGKRGEKNQESSHTVVAGSN